MAGLTVTRGDFDYSSAQAVIAVREAFEKTDTIFQFLVQNPSNAEGGDLLTKPAEENGFGYTDDEAYLIRIIFEGFNALDVESVLEQGRKLTGLA